MFNSPSRHNITVASEISKKTFAENILIHCTEVHGQNSDTN